MPFSEDAILTFTTEDRMRMFRTEASERFMWMLTEERAFDGLVCYNDIFAAHLIEDLRSKGMTLPKDLGIISFDNAEISALCHPALTTLAHPKERFGTVAAEKMLRMLEGQKEESEAMKWKLVDRESAPEKKKKA